MREHLTDKNYIESTIVTADDCGDGYSIQLKDNWCFFIDKKNEEDVIPKVGDNIKLYGKGVGYPIRGVVIEGKVVYYRNEAQQEENHRKWVDNYHNERKAAFEINRDKLDKDYSELPIEFRKRIDRFRKEDENFRWESEDYEMFVCTEAVKIAKTLKNSDQIAKFYKLPYEEQKVLVDISDAHSGNTFGGACALANAYVQGKDL